MLPVVAGADETRRQILIYSLVLAPIGASPWLLGYSGLGFGIVAPVIPVFAKTFHVSALQATAKTGPRR